MKKELLKTILNSDILVIPYLWIYNLHRRLKSFYSGRLNEYYTQQFKKKVQSFGSGSRVNGEITFFFPRSIFVGNNVHIGRGAFLDGRGGIIIGDNTHISRNLTVYSTNHNYDGQRLPYDHCYVAKEVIIGKNVWIGMNVSITPGVRIGDGAIIGMGAVISKNVGKGEIVVSGQQRVVGSRDLDSYRRVDSNENYGGISGFEVKPSVKTNYLVSPLKAIRAIFVLSTGRAGSTSMARMFDNEAGISAFHETFHFMIGRLSIEYIAGRIERNDVKEKLIHFFEEAKIVQQGNIYLESDQNLAPFIEILNEIFNEPKFIWIVRHPQSFMHSATSRGWFRESSPVFFREHVLVDPIKGVYRTRLSGAITGEYTEDQWQNLDQRIKVLWYWKYWNMLIERGLSNVPGSQQLFVQMENLKKEGNRILDFVGLETNRYKEVKKTNPVLRKDRKEYTEMKRKNHEFFINEGQKFVEHEMRKMKYST